MLTEEEKLEMVLENKRIDENLNKIKYKIMVFSGKGGVGKTTLSANLACGLQKNGYKVGILDADVSGPNIPAVLGSSGVMKTVNRRIIPFMFDGIKVVSFAGMIESDEPVMWSGPMKSKLLKQFVADVEWGELDFLIADLPPGTGDEITTIRETIKPDLAIIVTTPQELSLSDTRRAVNMAKKMDIPKIALIENMAGFKCPTCNLTYDIFCFGGGERQAIEMGIKFLGRLPLSIEFRYGLDWEKIMAKSEIQNDIMSIVHKIEEGMWSISTTDKNHSVLISENAH